MPSLIGCIFLLMLGPQQDNPGLTLEQAIDLARTRNERALIAEESAAAAAARVAKARSYFFPQLAVNGNYTRRAFEVVRTVGGEDITISNRNALSATANVTLTLFDSRSIPLFRQMLAEREAGSADAANTIRLLQFDAANAFLMTLSTGRVVDAARQRYEYARKNLAAARARFAAQLAGINDVTRAELELATAEREVTRAEGSMRSSRLQMGYLLNTEIAGELAIPETLLSEAATLAIDSSRLIAEALRRRPDLAAGRAHARAANAWATEPILRLLPSLSAVGQYRTTNEAGFSGKSSNWFIGVNLDWVLFDAGGRFADIREQTALARIADLNEQALERRVALDIRTAIVELSNQQATLVQARVARDAAHRNAGEVSELYRQGLASALHVADANLSQYEADVTLVREEYGLAIAFLDLRAALGLDPLGKEAQ